MTRILDPTDERVPVRRTLAKRPAKITGTVALLDINKARGDVMIDQLMRRLAERLPGVSLKSYRKPTPAKPAPDETRRQIMEQSDFVIEALAD
ncbi:MAG: UGSC family (seleno)protein [Candidatus Binataceae bacterium]